MMKVFIIAVVFLFNSCSQTVIPMNAPKLSGEEKIEIKETKVEFKIEKLSAQGKEAYQRLLEAKTFEEGLIGFAAQLSQNVKSFNDLLEEKDADAAFKSLLKNAEIAGQLYALSGVFYTDNEYFQEVVKEYQDSETEVSRMSGCEISNDKVKNIVKSNSPKVVIISPNQTMKDWWEKNKGGSYELDILNGGYPATFRNYKDYNKKKN